jgi:SWI/SNF-related matrix-associated actin-dependent regulator of chromatin subfamily A member 5
MGTEAPEEELETEDLTEAEVKEKDKLLKKGFGTWNRREYLGFIRGCEYFGRDNYKFIATEIPTKTEKEIEEYGKVFWKKYKELKGTYHV